MMDLHDMLDNYMLDIHMLDNYMLDNYIFDGKKTCDQVLDGLA